MSAKPAAGHEGAYVPVYDPRPIRDYVVIGNKFYHAEDFCALGGITMSPGPACPQCHGTGLYDPREVHVPGQPVCYRSSVCDLHPSRWGPDGPPVMASHAAAPNVDFSSGADDDELLEAATA